MIKNNPKNRKNLNYNNKHNQSIQTPYQLLYHSSFNLPLTCAVCLVNKAVRTPYKMPMLNPPRLTVKNDASPMKYC